jgi:hypothetical protein
VVAIALALAAAFALVAAVSASAARKATRAEAAAIKRLATKPCADGPSGCTWNGARVSTADPRFAWADVTGEGYSGALVKRPRKGSLRFRVIGTQGGGIGECRFWRKRATDAVLRDLRIAGLVDRNGTVRNCGRR